MRIACYTCHTAHTVKHAHCTRTVSVNQTRPVPGLADCRRVHERVGLGGRRTHMHAAPHAQLHHSALGRYIKCLWAVHGAPNGARRARHHWGQGRRLGRPHQIVPQLLAPRWQEPEQWPLDANRSRCSMASGRGGRMHTWLASFPRPRPCHRFRRRPLRRSTGAEVFRRARGARGEILFRRRRVVVADVIDLLRLTHPRWTQAGHRRPPYRPHSRGPVRPCRSAGRGWPSPSSSRRAPPEARPQ